LASHTIPFLVESLFASTALLDSARVSQTAAAGQISHYPDASCGCSAGPQPGKRRPEDATT